MRVKSWIFPNPTLTFLNPKLTFADHPTVIESEKLCLDFNIISIAWGRTEPSEVYAFGVKLHASIPPFQVWKSSNCKCGS